jgi:hypothetical protein
MRLVIVAVLCLACQALGLASWSDSPLRKGNSFALSNPAEQDIALAGYTRDDLTLGTSIVDSQSLMPSPQDSALLFVRVLSARLGEVDLEDEEVYTGADCREVSAYLRRPADRHGDPQRSSFLIHGRPRSLQNDNGPITRPTMYQPVGCIWREAKKSIAVVMTHELAMHSLGSLRYLIGSNRMN